MRVMSVGLVTAVLGEISLGGVAGGGCRTLGSWGCGLKSPFNTKEIRSGNWGQERLVIGVCAACAPDAGSAWTMGGRNRNRENGEKRFTRHFREGRVTE